MIGCAYKNNDLFIFFEEGEIERLENNTIQGTFLNLKYKKAILEARLGEPKKQTLIDTNIEGTFETLTKIELIIKPSLYQGLKERGKFEDHQGYRHINLLNIEFFEEEFSPFSFEGTYQSLKEIIED